MHKQRKNWVEKATKTVEISCIRIVKIIFECFFFLDLKSQKLFMKVKFILFMETEIV